MEIEGHIKLFQNIFIWTLGILYLVGELNHGLKLVHFREYHPMPFVHQISQFFRFLRIYLCS